MGRGGLRISGREEGATKGASECGVGQDERPRGAGRGGVRSEASRCKTGQVECGVLGRGRAD